MRFYHALSEADLAQYFMQHKGAAYQPASAAILVADVKIWLRSAGFAHRVDDAVDIAIDAFEIGKQIQAQQPTATEAEVAFQDDVQAGFGDQRVADPAVMQRAQEIAKASQVAQMDMATFAANRTKLGTHVGLVEFLLGQG